MVAISGGPRARPRKVGFARPTAPVTDFVKVSDGWVNSTFYKDGATVSLTERAARYLLLRKVVRRPSPPPAAHPHPARPVAPAPVAPAAAKAELAHE
jgi:hypothetical protein